MGFGGPAKPTGAAMLLGIIAAAAQAQQDSVATEGERDTMDDDEPYYDEPETFGDGLPCPRCKGHIEQHELSEERDSRGRRKWVCPA